MMKLGLFGAVVAMGLASGAHAYLPPPGVVRPPPPSGMTIHETCMNKAGVCMDYTKCRTGTPLRNQGCSGSWRRQCCVTKTGGFGRPGGMSQASQQGTMTQGSQQPSAGGTSSSGNAPAPSTNDNSGPSGKPPAPTPLPPTGTVCKVPGYSGKCMWKSSCPQPGGRVFVGHATCGCKPGVKCKICCVEGMPPASTNDNSAPSGKPPAPRTNDNSSPSNKYSAKDIDIAARTVYDEARGQGTQVQEAVMWVILNRLRDSRWPNTLAGVCLQRSQFSGWNGAWGTRRMMGLSQSTIKGAKAVVMKVLSSGSGRDPTRGATAFHGKILGGDFPRGWVRSHYILTVQIGEERFYIEKRVIGRSDAEPEAATADGGPVIGAGASGSSPFLQPLPLTLFAAGALLFIAAVAIVVRARSHRYHNARSGLTKARDMEMSLADEATQEVPSAVEL